MPHAALSLKRAALRVLQRGARAPLGEQLSELRAAAGLELLQALRPQTQKLRAGLLQGRADARAELRALGDRALTLMRDRVGEKARRSRATAVLFTLDCLWQKADEQEYLDSPIVDRARRVRILRHLDQMNALCGNYPAFFHCVKPLLSPRERTRVLDLAAGHGGFAYALKNLAEIHGLDVEVTASDIKREYLELGVQRQRLQKQRIGFMLQDALDLSNLVNARYDVITCTQSLHHFSPGEVAVMFHEAARCAAKGVVFIDGSRGALNAAMVGSLGLILYRDRALAHDAFVSFRRFYVTEELSMLASLSPFGRRAKAGWMAPGHCFVELRRD